MTKEEIIKLVKEEIVKSNVDVEKLNIDNIIRKFNEQASVI